METKFAVILFFLYSLIFYSGANENPIKTKKLSHVYISSNKNKTPQIKVLKPLKCPSYNDFVISNERHAKSYGPYYSKKENGKMRSGK